MEKMMLKQITLDMEVGKTAYLTGQDADPDIVMEVSFDGGYTYGLRKRRSIGKQGEYKKHVSWRVKGVGRSIVPKFTFSGKVQHSLFQISIRYSELMPT
jgi:hypothetical protein